MTSARRHSHRTAGVTLIELLVSITMLSVLILSVAPLLVSSVQVTRVSSTAASATTTARGVLEGIEMQWSVPATSKVLDANQLGALRERYDRTCAEITDGFSGVPAGAIVSVTNVKPSLVRTQADVVTPAALQVVTPGESCTAAPDDPPVPIKRLELTVTDAGKTISRLMLEVHRP